MKTVAILVTNSCFASTVHSLLDAFACANFVGSDLEGSTQFESVIVSLDGKPVNSMSGHQIAVDYSIKNAPDDLDVIIIVPSISPFASLSEVEQSIKPTVLLHPWLRKQSEKGILITASCTGSFLLAETGLLDGRIATTHWRASHTFSQRYPEVILQADELLTEDGNFMCGGGAVSCLDLALHLIRRFGSTEQSLRCAQVLVVDPARDRQSPYTRFEGSMDHQDELVIKVQKHLERNYTQKLDIATLANSLHISDRTLKRRFTRATGLSIGSYLQAVRIEVARDRLTSTGRSLQSIVQDVGYEDVSSFSRLFKQTTGLTMKSYRERFNVSESTS